MPESDIVTCSPITHALSPWNYKDRLNLRRTLTYSESASEGKLFVEFVALIDLSYINKKMEDGHLYSRYTMHELLDELDVIECFLEP